MSEQPISLPELAELHAAMEATIRQAMPQVVDVQHYPKLEEGMPMPALYFALSGLAPGPDPGDGRTALMATFEACVLVESDREQAHLQAAILASKLFRLLDHDQYWGVDCVDLAHDIHAMPSESIPELLQCAAWTVQWRHVLYVGDTEWPWDDQPGKLVFAFDPETGPAHKDGYFEPEALG